MASLAFELALLALFYSSKTETHGQIITVPAELHTTIDLPCRCPISPESTALVQWYRSSNSDVYLKDGKALASWSVGTSSSLQGFGITDDFSMIIYNLTDQHNQELYRCIISPLGGGAAYTHDVKLDIYAYPDSSPVIEFIRQTSGFNVTCSISNVFPMTFPILTSKGRNGTAYTNIDGTYNTSVTHLFPANENDTTIDCLYSNSNFKSIASLRIVASDQNTTDDTDNTDCRPKPSGLWMVWIILITDVIFIVIVIAIKTRRVLRNRAQGRTTQNSRDVGGQDEHHGENSKVEEPVECTRVVLFSKRTFAVFSLTVQIILFILLVAYLSTAKCLNEPDVKLEGNVPVE